MLSWFEFRRRNEARWDRLIDAAVEARHHGVAKPQRLMRSWAPTALAAVALAGIGGMAGHTLAAPTTISVASAAESSAADGASTSVPGRADEPGSARGASEAAAGPRAGDDDIPAGAGAGASTAPGDTAGGSSAGAGTDGAEQPEGSAPDAGQPTVIGPIIAGDTAVGPITVTRGPQGPEVVGEVPVEEGDGGGSGGRGGSPTLTATPAPPGAAAPDDGSANGSGAGSASPPTSGTNPGSGGASPDREGASSGPTSGAQPSGSAGAGTDEDNGNSEDRGADAADEPDQPEDEPGTAGAGSDGQAEQDAEAEQCETSGSDPSTDDPGSSGSADAPSSRNPDSTSGSGASSSSTTASESADSELSAGSEKQGNAEPDQDGAGSGGSSGEGSGTGRSQTDSNEKPEQQNPDEDGAQECADDDGNSNGGASASEDDGGLAGKATDALFSLTGVEGFDLGQGGNVENGEVPAEAPSPNVPGHTAVKMELPAGGKRSEVRPQEVAQDIKAGQRMFFGYSAFLPEDFPTDASDFQVIWQLHSESSTSSPPLALEVQQGKLWLANVGELVEDLGPVSPGENVTVQMGIDFEVGGGSVTVWRDGQEILTDFQPPRGTMIDNLNYLKTGLYRREEGSPASSLFLNDMKVGDTLESVSGLAGGPTATREGGVAGALGSTTGALLGGALPVAGMRWRRRRMEW